MTVVVVVTIVVNLAFGIADLIPASFVLANSREVDVPVSAVPVLGVLKIAGAVGLALGLAGVPAIGEAAAVGLCLFFVGAVATHVRARVYYNLAFPGTFLALAIATLVVLLAR